MSFFKNSLSPVATNMAWHLEQGRQALAGKHFQKAAWSFFFVARRQPKNLEALEGLGLTLFNALDNHNAYAIFLALNQMKPEHPRYLYHLASVYYRLGEYEKARALLQVVLDSATNKAPSLYLMGLLEYAMGNKTKAVKLLEKSHDANVSDPAPLVASAHIYALARNFHQAKQKLWLAKPGLDEESWNALMNQPIFSVVRKAFGYGDSLP